MTTKLTLTIDEQVISLAKAYAKSKGQSLSQLVENYLKLLTVPEKNLKKPDQPPKISSLQGILRVDEDFDYKKVLREEREKKHGR